MWGEVRRVGAFGLDERVAKDRDDLYFAPSGLNQIFNLEPRVALRPLCGLRCTLGWRVARLWRALRRWAFP